MLVINNTPLKNVRDIELSVDVSGNRLLSFTSVLKNENIKEEAIVELDGYEYRIKQLIETSYTQEVVAPSTFFDLAHVQKHEIFGGTKRISEFLNWLSADTSWTFVFNGNDKSILMPNFGNDNVIKLINELIRSANIEYKIDRNKTVIFDDMIGPDNDYQYRYNHNIKTLNRHVDTTQLKTVITGYGKDNLKVTYISPNVSKFGRLEAEAIRDERFTNSSSLTEYIKSKLNDTPDVSIELDVYQLKDKEIGERIWLIYEPLDIEMQTRVMALNYKYINDNFIVTSVVLGNDKLKSQTDILSEQIVEIDNDNKQMQSRIEQTNDRITLEVEELERSVSRIELRSDRIELSVSILEDDVNSSISILQNEINLKVNKNGVINAINISPESIDISANKINFDGHVFGGNATFTGTISGSSIHGGRYYGADGSSDKIDFGQGYVSLTGDGIRLARHSRSYLSIDGTGNFFLYGNYMNNTQNIVARFNNKSGSGGHLTINEITVTNFNNSSARELKKNIKKADFNGLKKVMSTPIYQHHFKTQDDRELKHTGTIYDESPAEMVSPNGDSISPYAMTSILWKAVQELNRKVDDLDNGY